MKASELVETLKRLIDCHGDQEVLISQFCNDYAYMSAEFVEAQAVMPNEDDREELTEDEYAQLEKMEEEEKYNCFVIKDWD